MGFTDAEDMIIAGRSRLNANHCTTEHWRSLSVFSKFEY